MAALTKNSVRHHKIHDRQINEAPADAGKTFFVGALISREAATGLCVPATDTAGEVVLGVVIERAPSDNDTHDPAYHLQNATGADGVLTATTADRVVQYDQAGEYAFAVSAGTPLVGAPAFVVDDNTVSAAATTNNRIAGHFTRPSKTAGWLVDIARRNTAVT